MMFPFFSAGIGFGDQVNHPKQILTSSRTENFIYDFSHFLPTEESAIASKDRSNDSAPNSGFSINESAQSDNRLRATAFYILNRCALRRRFSLLTKVVFPLYHSRRLQRLLARSLRFFLPTAVPAFPSPFS